MDLIRSAKLIRHQLFHQIVKRGYVFLIIFISQLFWSGMLLSQEVNTVPTYPIIKNKEIKNFTVQTGTWDTSFKMTDGTDWNMFVSIPKEIDQQLPLIIALHWAGDAVTYREFFTCLVQPAFKNTNAVVVAPSSNGIHWIFPNNEKRVVRLVKQLIKYWPIDPKKVVVTGYSNGGISSWQLAKKFPKLFCAAIPMAGSYTLDPIKIPVYAIHGTKDEVFPLHQVQNQLAQSSKKGSLIKLYKMQRSHYQACAYPFKLQEVFEEIKSIHF